MRGITRDSFAEMIDRKIIFIFGSITLLVIIGVLFTSNISINGFGGDEMKLDDLNQALGNPMMVFFSWFMSFLVFLTVMATAGILPNMLVKGRADYYLSKPISRSSLLLNKLLGIWISYGSMIFICGLLTYSAIVLVHGGFQFKIIYIFIFSLLSYFCWLAVLFFAGVMSGSQPISIMSAFIVWVLYRVLLSVKMVQDIISSQFVKTSIDVLYYIIPKNSEFFDIGENLVLDKPVNNWSDFYTTVIVSIILIFASVYLFKKKNY